MKSCSARARGPALAASSRSMGLRKRRNCLRMLWRGPKSDIRANGDPSWTQPATLVHSLSQWRISARAADCVLAAMVGGYRGRNRKSIGHSDDAVLERKVRRHANMTEYAPIFLAVLTLYEIIAGQTTSVLWLADRVRCRQIVSRHRLFLVSRLASGASLRRTAGLRLFSGCWAPD